MAAGRYDTTIEQGATFSRQVTWQSQDGSAINLTGYTLSGKIRKKASDAKELISFTCTIVNASSGIFTFSLTAAETSGLPSAYGETADKELLPCVYDIEASIGSTVYRILEGIINISPQVTR